MQIQGVTENVISKVNGYIYADELRKLQDEFIKTHGTQVAHVRGCFGDMNTYCYAPQIHNRYAYY